MDSSPQGFHAVFERFREILRDGEVNKKTQYLIKEEDRTAFKISIDDEIEPENDLDVFQVDPDFESKQEQYEEFRREILGSELDTKNESPIDVQEERVSKIVYDKTE